MGNQQIQTVICGVPRLVSYFPAKPQSVHKLGKFFNFCPDDREIQARLS